MAKSTRAISKNASFPNDLPLPTTSHDPQPRFQSQVASRSLSSSPHPPMPSSRSSKRRAAEPESSSDEDMKIEAIADSAGTSQSSRSKGKRAHAHLADAASASGSGSASSSQKAVQDIILLDSEPDEPPAESAAPSESIPLSSYTCPICFYPPASAVLTPCGHILCGECLFTAVSSAQARQPGPAGAARCPVCRAILEGWDGRGGGVIGLEVRQVITL